jgi:CubicO group peptidase (beta-lactamase class C family)
MRLRDGSSPRRPLTLRHLLTHTSCLDTGAAPVDPQAAPDLMTLARRVASVPLAAEPGSRFRYDGINTDVLCRVVEVVSGRPFGRFLRERLFEPLGMVDTGFSVPSAQRHRVVDITSVDDNGRLVLAPPRRPVSRCATTTAAPAACTRRRATTCASPRCCSTKAGGAGNACCRPRPSL